MSAATEPTTEKKESTMYPEGMSPRELTRGRWVKNGKGTRRWQPDEFDVEEREAIAHLLDHSDSNCARCRRGLLLSRRGERTRERGGSIPGRVIELGNEGRR